MSNNRILYIDGFRGIAVIWVIFYHAFSRWPSIVPYGDIYSDTLFFKYGKLGVQLFFIISGYVILMTLERSSGVKNFLWRRWIRLFPAMLFCTFFLYCTANFFEERPAGIPDIKSVLPGLFFLEPKWIGLFFNEKINPLEGSFWSIYVEVKFYIISALIFYHSGRVGRNYIVYIFCIFLVGVFFGLTADIFNIKWLRLLVNNLSIEHFGWFSCGAAFYLYKKTLEKKFIYQALFSGFASSLYIGKNDFVYLMLAALVVCVFCCAVCFSFFRYILSNKITGFIGVISYPLYLLHENILISLSIKLGKVDDNIFVNFLIILVILFILAKMVEKYAEPFVKKIILIIGDRLKSVFW